MDPWLESDSEEDEDLALLSLAVVALWADGARLARAERRFPIRRYLCRAQLLPNPRQGTPWQVIYESHDDRAFITTMGIDCATFHAILHAGFTCQ